MCGYEMRGLPAVHTCPECGFDCDPQAMVFPLSTHAPDIHYIGQSGGLMILCLLASQRRMFDRGSSLAIMVLLAAVVVWYATRIVRRTGAPSSLIVNRTGLYYYDAGRVVTAIPWCQIARADWSRVTGALVVVDHLGKALLRTGVARLGSSKNSRRCVADINRLLVAYKTP
jgi:hypothetical protein